MFGFASCTTSPLPQGTSCGGGDGACDKTGTCVCKDDGNLCTTETYDSNTEKCLSPYNSYSESCYSGPAGTEGKGICKAGTKTCSDGSMGACAGEVLPTQEICGNGLDDDCDGVADNGCPVCGNNIVEGSEVCDNGDNNNDTKYDACKTDCSGKVPAICGNGIVEGAEQCDGAVGVGPHQKCESDCTLTNLTYCGDGTVQNPNGEGVAEECDDGNSIDTDACSNNCAIQTVCPATLTVTQTGNLADATVTATVSGGEWTTGTINWGDGKSTNVTASGSPSSATVTHTYASPGTYSVTLSNFKNGSAPAGNCTASTSTTVKICAPDKETKPCTVGSDPQCNGGRQTCNSDGSGWNACQRITEGNSCDDNSACTQSDSCSDGVCVGSNPVVCAASDQCHDAGTCDSSTGQCSNPPKEDGASCDDGDSSTEGDSCQKGICSGTPVETSTSPAEPAADPEPVSPEPESPKLESAEPEPQPEEPSMTSGEPSQPSEEPSMTSGEPAPKSVCESGTQESCDPGFDPKCTQGSRTCKEDGSAWGSCVPASGASCDDGDKCNGEETCEEGVCTAGLQVLCLAPKSQCQIAACNPKTGLCDATDKPDETQCDDGNLCTQTDTCQSGICSGSNPVVCAASDQCHEAGTCDAATGVCSDPEKKSVTCETTVSKGCTVGGSTQCVEGKMECQPYIDEMNKCPQEQEEEKIPQSEPVAAEPESPEPEPQAGPGMTSGAPSQPSEKPSPEPTPDEGEETPPASAGALISLPDKDKIEPISEIFEIGNTLPDNRTCTVLLENFSSAVGIAAFHPGDFEKQFLIVAGEAGAGNGVLAYIPPKATGHLGIDCTDLAEKIRYLELSAPLENIAPVLIGEKTALIGLSDNDYCYYPEVEAKIEAGDLGGNPVCAHSGINVESRTWKEGRTCNISQIENFRVFSHGDARYAVGGVTCTVVPTDPPTEDDPVFIVGLDIGTKTAQGESFQWSFVVLEKLPEGEELRAILLDSSSRQEGKLYAIVTTQKEEEKTTRLFTIKKEGGNWTHSAKDLPGEIFAIINKDDIRRDQPADTATGNKILISKNQLMEIKEADGDVKVYDPATFSFRVSGESVSARFAPNDNAWNVYSAKGPLVAGVRITLDADNNPKADNMDDREILTAASETNNVCTDGSQKCHLGHPVLFTRKNFGGPDFAAIVDVDDNSKAVALAYNYNEKPKLESNAWQTDSGIVFFEASDPAHDDLINTVKSFKDTNGNDISCWIDSVGEKQVAYTRRGACPGVSGDNAGNGPLAMEICTEDAGAKSDCKTIQLSKSVAAVGEVKIPDQEIPAVIGDSGIPTPGYKISGGCGCDFQGRTRPDAVFLQILLLLLPLTGIFYYRHVLTSRKRLP